MEEALRFFRAYEVWIYLLLALGGLFYARKFIHAWQELRDAAFGLERDNAQARLNQAASILVILLAMAITEFVLVSFIAPAVPGAVPLPTATLNILATPTTTLPPGQPTTSALPELQTTATTPPPEETAQTGCIPGQVEILVPLNGAEIGGVVQITGTVDIPNFGFYKLEMKRVEESNWLTILAGNEPKTNGLLGSWNTSLLSPGNHQLSLVAADNTGQSLPPCTIEVRVTNLTGTPQP
jgi:hypothetical protein